MSKATELAETLDRWVGIGEASRLLGVRPATVRRWTKQDHLKAFVTPGGHRRYKVGDLLEYTDRNLRSEEEAAGLAALTATDRREEVSEAREQSWYGLLDRSDRDAYRERGRETLRLIESFLGDGDGGDELITAMEGQGACYGNHAADLGMSLRELITAFNLFRRPLIARIETVEGATSRQGIFERITDMFDLYMAAMVEAYLERTLRPITARQRETHRGGGAGK
ncbi:MAG: helix-turn-helix domain-containing protein [Chloroflexota bacterium]|jgi:excisionase family DNA binding protein|nr:helix-turn-helix domain-containing protein [Chloroflexota bacterium]MDP6507581.1 helix-turn-helix domain-containing protein [Chloroflexota bacterium]MDP6757395.1 helix-turn-helix domain-containing protein [Chloroflexota bacterium]